jgi:hypothetical protein
MKPIFIRGMREDEVPKFVDWQQANQAKNDFDPGVMATRSTMFTTAYNHEGAAAFMPIQQVYVLDSFAPKPGASAGENAAALKAIVQFSVTKAHENGVGEILFFATDKETVAAALNHFEFEEIPYPVYRLKIAGLEPKA